MRTPLRLLTLAAIIAAGATRSLPAQARASSDYLYLWSGSADSTQQRAVVSLDIADPAHPREVSRVAFDSAAVPHWISVEPNHRRVVVTGYGSLSHRVMMVSFDERTGRLALDTRFRDPGATEPGVRMDGKSWPHGGSAAAIPHGAVLSYGAPPRPSP